MRMKNNMTKDEEQARKRNNMNKEEE